MGLDYILHICAVHAGWGPLIYRYGCRCVMGVDENEQLSRRRPTSHISRPGHRLVASFVHLLALPAFVRDEV